MNYYASGNPSLSQFTVAARHRDKIIWTKSSSGRAFSAVCKAYCNNGDTIFSARFDGLDVVHDCISHPDPIDDLMESKYVQSDMLNGLSTPFLSIRSVQVAEPPRFFRRVKFLIG